jgi:glutamyl-tRNA reductase
VKLLLLGMNHRTAPVAIRERFAAPELEAVLGKLAATDEIDELVLVSTCNRVELVATTRQPEAARHRLDEFFSRGSSADEPALEEDHLYEYRDRDVVRHVFRVASAMDSMVVGEPQVLGQLKDAYRRSVEIGTCGPVLSRLFQRAFSTAKRVRNETRIAERPVSVAKVAVDLASQIFEQLQDKSALLVGAGEMVEAALYALRREGLTDLYVANRTVERAQELAARFSATAHDLEQLDDLLGRADIVLTCIGGRDPVLTADRVQAAIRVRRNRPCFLIDLGVPRNIDPAVNALENAYLYDIDDLQEVAASNAEERRREAEQGERIVLEEEQQFDGWLMALQAVPTIRHLRARADAIRQQELRRFSAGSGLDDQQLERVDGLTRSLINKILHAPLARLRAQTDREEGLAVLEAARELFALDDETAPGAHIDVEVAGERPKAAADDSEAGDGKPD